MRKSADTTRCAAPGHAFVALGGAPFAFPPAFSSGVTLDIRRCFA